MPVEFEQQAKYEFEVSRNSVMQIPQESLVLVSSNVTSHSISGIPLDALSVLDNSFLSDESGNLLNMTLDSGAEEHSGFWTVRKIMSRNGRGVRTITEMIQNQKDAVFTSGAKHSTKNVTMLLRHSSWLNHLVRNDFMGCKLDILEFTFGSVW